MNRGLRHRCSVSTGNQWLNWKPLPFRYYLISDYFPDALTAVGTAAFSPSADDNALLYIVLTGVGLHIWLHLALCGLTWGEREVNVSAFLSLLTIVTSPLRVLCNSGYYSTCSGRPYRPLYVSVVKSTYPPQTLIKQKHKISQLGGPTLKFQKMLFYLKYL